MKLMTGDERGLMVKVVGGDDHHQTCGYQEYRENRSLLDFRLQCDACGGSDDGVVVVREGRFGLGWHPPRRLRHHCRQCQRAVARGTWSCASAAR
jgi:hypothetical protein